MSNPEEIEGAPQETSAGETRRSFVKKAAYVAPIILTLGATPAFANGTSHQYSFPSEWKEEWEEYQNNPQISSILQYLRNLFN